MSEKTADLHIHSYYSDGTMSPEEILRDSVKNNVGLIAITDHDIIEGSLELQKLCEGLDIKYLSGVELDVLENGVNYHILSYGADLTEEAFVHFIKQNRGNLENVNTTLIQLMEENGEPVSVSDYNSFSYDKRGGGWKALHYLMSKGLTTSLREGFGYYTKYNCTYEVSDFPTVKAVCEQIHNAGGKAILAHPGVTIKESDLMLFQNKLLRSIHDGIDGVECYYVTHSVEITELCLTMCKERNLLITAGSDCHGEFGNACVGDVNVPISKLHLGNLLS